MTDAVITVENLSKSYLVGHQSAARSHGDYVALRDVIVQGARDFARKTGDVIRGRQVVQGDEVEEFWALKDVSFKVKRGEVLGIIGGNGAGKSTLLKILSRITDPTRGRVILRGRVASLLEVGTGFHPELTGRENIFLNGAILGMTQREIRKKFDEIVAFAEVEKFLDTPVKRYSSGMYVRLAFAVAAHLEPEILIVDEVLAVGDAEFQKKCLGRMQDVAAGGRTVLFVSHNMGAVLQLTRRALLFSAGILQYDGQTSLAVEEYQSCSSGFNTVEYDVAHARRKFEGNGDARITRVRFERPLAHFRHGEPIRYAVELRGERNIDRIRASMTIFARDGTPIGSGFSREIDGLTTGEERELVVELSSTNLAPGEYHCGVAVGKGDHRTASTEYDVVHDILVFNVMPEETALEAMSVWTPGWGSISFPEMDIQWKP